MFANGLPDEFFDKQRAESAPHYTYACGFSSYIRQFIQYVADNTIPDTEAIRILKHCLDTATAQETFNEVRTAMPANAKLEEFMEKMNAIIMFKICQYSDARAFIQMRQGDAGISQFARMCEVEAMKHYNRDHPMFNFMINHVFMAGVDNEIRERLCCSAMDLSFHDLIQHAYDIQQEIIREREI